MENYRAEPSEGELMINVMKLLNDQATHLRSNIDSLSVDCPKEEEIKALSEEISALTGCIEAVANLALERLKNPGMAGRSFGKASRELVRQASDIQSKLTEIKNFLMPISKIYN